MLEIYTYTIYGVKKFKNNKDYKILDVTIKSGIKEFAPSWDLVKDWKKGYISEKSYTDAYINLMRKSYKHNTKLWYSTIHTKEKLILCCYCHSDEFCHRKILANLLVKTAKHYNIDAIYKGELI